jgi:hypothetical protein
MMLRPADGPQNGSVRIARPDVNGCRPISAAFADIRMAKHGVRIGTNPTNPALAAPLRRARWRQEQDWRDKPNGYRVWWFPPAGDAREGDTSDFGWYD